ncbi:molybdopterin adenylyltransferase [Candidatus Chlorohelix sp.]|uniref:molybdopterin adenylyltransferase n=1 Tax=Candidatus Chlorohelix sp. TaxID=3139201 RepID=UPI0030325A7B
MEFRVGILTLSDKGSRGERQDTSGPGLHDLLTEKLGDSFRVEAYEIIPDDRLTIEAKLKNWSDDLRLNLILTTGGTGVAPRDVTPDATLNVIEKQVPGMAEAMRFTSLQKTPMAVISRAVAGIRGQTLIINLPGSPKGARESLEPILPALAHALEKILGDTSDCAPSP